MSPSINFTANYTKLKQNEFHTVRWIDSDKYVVGKLYDIVLIGKSHSLVRIEKIEIKKMYDLSIVFIAEDINQDGMTGGYENIKKLFFSMMEKWYSKKPDWKGWDSEVLILYCKKV